MLEKNSLVPYVIDNLQEEKDHMIYFSRLLKDRIIFLGEDVK